MVEQIIILVNMISTFMLEMIIKITIIKFRAEKNKKRKLQNFRFEAS